MIAKCNIKTKVLDKNDQPLINFELKERIN